MRLPAKLDMIAAGFLGACAQPAGVAGPVSLAQQWMIGVERMQGDPLPQLPFTNRFIADLAAMPNAQVVYLGTAENAGLFGSWSGGRLRVSPSLRGERSCMTVTYTIFQSGEQQGVFGLVIPPPPAGTEPDSACVDRAAGTFYQALAVQGL
jgi:hypothetical protein